MHLKLARIGEFTLDRPRIMGILNATPDSFSDGGKWISVDAAIRHAMRMIDEGAELIDVGGESTRPRAMRVDADEQIRRVVPVIEALHAKLRDDKRRVAISIDTTRASVAQAAIDAGAQIINDVAAGREDDRMFALAAARGVPMVLMHMQGEPTTMQRDPKYNDVVAEVLTFLQQRVAAAEAAGVSREQMVIDPGIGFGKTREHNIALLAALDRFVATGHPVLLGTSRKRFMGSICTPTLADGSPGQPPTPAELVGATCATTALGVAAGVRLFRVHDVLPNRQAAAVAFAITDHAGRGNG